MDIFVTAGAGDFLSILGFMTDAEKESVQRIFYATRAEKLIKLLTPKVFPNLKEEITACNEFTPSEELNKNPTQKDLVDKFCVHSKQDLIERFPLLIPASSMLRAEDFTMMKIAQEAIDGKRKYNPLKEILNSTIVEVDSPYNFPYVFIHPWSDNQRYEERDFSNDECERVVKYLEKKNMYGLVINKSDDAFPVKSEWIIDATNKYTFLESIELLKKAKGGFIGTASVFSVLASKLFFPDSIIIKGSPELRRGWHLFYYAPHKYNYFIHPNLKFL